MWIVDLDAKVVHDMSRPQYECHINEISKDNRKKIFTLDGVKRFLSDPINKGFQGCQHCLPDFYQHDMTSIFG